MRILLLMAWFNDAVTSNVSTSITQLLYFGQIKGRRITIVELNYYS